MWSFGARIVDGVYDSCRKCVDTCLLIQWLNHLTVNILIAFTNTDCLVNADTSHSVWLLAVCIKMAGVIRKFCSGCRQHSFTIKTI